MKSQTMTGNNFFALPIGILENNVKNLNGVGNQKWINMDEIERSIVERFEDSIKCFVKDQL